MFDFATLCRYCEQDGWPLQVDQASQTLRTRFGGDNTHYDALLRVDTEREVLLLLVPFYLRAPRGEHSAQVRLRLLELLLHINYEILYGNFELDLSDGEVRFRLSIPFSGGGVTLDTFQRCGRAMAFACDHFFPAFQRVLWADLTPEQALATLAGPDPGGNDGEDLNTL